MTSEGYTKYVCTWKNAELPELEIQDLIEFRNWLHQENLIGILPDGVGFGNVSKRVSSGTTFVISGTQTGQVPQAERAQFSFVESFSLEANSLVCIGSVAASSESLTHAAIYSSAPQVQWVLHFHQPEFWKSFYGKLPTTPGNIDYGTTELAWAVSKITANTSIGFIILGGHQDGVVLYAPSIAELRSQLWKYGLARRDM